MAADGTWNIAIETPMGTRNTTLVLKTEGGALKGTQSEGSNSTEIADGGEAYPAGVRDLARRFAEDTEARVQTLATIAGRSA